MKTYCFVLYCMVAAAVEKVPSKFGLEVHAELYSEAKEEECLLQCSRNTDCGGRIAWMLKDSVYRSCKNCVDGKMLKENVIDAFIYCKFKRHILCPGFHGGRGCAKCVETCKTESCPSGMIFTSCARNTQLSCRDKYYQGSMRCSESNFCACPKCTALMNGKCVAECPNGNINKILKSCREDMKIPSCQKTENFHYSIAVATTTTKAKTTFKIQIPSTTTQKTAPTFYYPSTVAANITEKRAALEATVPSTNTEATTKSRNIKADVKTSSAYVHGKTACPPSCKKNDDCSSAIKIKNIFGLHCSEWFDIYCDQEQPGAISCVMGRATQAFDACPEVDPSAIHRFRTCYSCWQKCAGCKKTCEAFSSCMLTTKEKRRRNFRLLPRKCRHCVRNICGNIGRYHGECAYGVISEGCNGTCTDINACDYCYTC